MKTLVLLVAMSLMLVGATVVIAIPNQAEANYCSPLHCFNGKGNCVKANEGACVKDPRK